MEKVSSMVSVVRIMVAITPVVEALLETFPMVIPVMPTMNHHRWSCRETAASQNQISPTSTSKKLVQILTRVRIRRRRVRVRRWSIRVWSRRVMVSCRRWRVVPCRRRVMSSRWRGVTVRVTRV